MEDPRELEDAGDAAPAKASVNRLITGSILSFVVLSLAVVLLPLLGAEGGEPLLPSADRSSSHVLYASFLVVFLILVLPGFMDRDPDRRRVAPWASLTVYVLLFAAIPLIFTAYISGVSRHGLLSVAGICVAAGGLPMLLRRLLGARAGLLCWILGSVLLFAVPASTLYLESLGRAVPQALPAISPLGWLHRLGQLREVPPAWPFVVLAAAVWVLALAPLRRRRGALSAMAAGALITLVGAGSAAESASPPSPASAPPRVESLSGGAARAGLRTPLAITLPAGRGSAVVRLGAEAFELPRDGRRRSLLAVADEGASRIAITLGSEKLSIPVPYALVPASQLLVAWLVPLDAAGMPRIPGASPSRSVVSLDDLGVIPPQPGSFEAFDVIVFDSTGFAACGAPLRRAIEDYVTLGGHLMLVEEGKDAPRYRATGSGWITRVGGLFFHDQLLGRPRLDRPLALDPELVRTFARPDWQEMDLSALLVFAVLYHLAFLGAFVLPLLLDYRKSLGVYLVSVGFVVAVIAVGGYRVLGSIFLRDNQLYTQSISLVVLGPGENPQAASRQFLCFASMSLDEDRKLSFPGDCDLTLYRVDPGQLPLVRGWEEGRTTFLDVRLDRFSEKILLRSDHAGPSPIRALPESGADGGFVLDSVPGAPDPLGLRTAAVELAVIIEDGHVVRRLAAEGRRLRDDGPGTMDDFSGVERLFYGRLAGRFAPPPRRFLLLRMTGLLRPDAGADYLWERDLGGFVLVPLPAP